MTAIRAAVSTDIRRTEVREFDTPAIPADAFPRAEAAGRTIARQNRVGFQGSGVVDGDVVVAFGSSLAAGSLWSAAGAAAPASKYVRCTLNRGGFAPYFMQVMGFGAQSVAAIATATLTPAQSNCAVPLGVCRAGSAGAGASPPFGLVPGTWVSGRFKDGGGNWNWIDFSPPSGGESELAALLTGNGMCSLNVTAPVGAPGNMGNAAAKAWNTRFGLYQGSSNVTNAPPDFTGYAYTTTNWPAGANARLDFLSRRGAHAPYGSSVAAGTVRSTRNAKSRSSGIRSLSLSAGLPLVGFLRASGIASRSSSNAATGPVRSISVAQAG